MGKDNVLKAQEVEDAWELVKKVDNILTEFCEKCKSGQQG